MSNTSFDSKVICDSVHGPIGLSELEQEIINTRTFQRLKKIKQLGLASYVFPSAEHSRFAHSIGAMHIMSRMVDRLHEKGCPYLDDPKSKQTLRLAALLHDIGHYPLSHIGEQVYRLIDDEKTELLTSDCAEPDRDVLTNAAKTPKSDVARHERLGELILTHEHSELKAIIERKGFNPAEIAKIINGKDTDMLFYDQLMNSTLDCDRLDYLLRDSHATGTKYGIVDLDYIISNMTWDESEDCVCFEQKAIHAIEHFILARYFYYNIVYHKTVLGFEHMVKVLFLGMIQDPDLTTEYGTIVKSIDQVGSKIRDDPEFLSNFNDEYFWYYLDRWKPKGDILPKIKKNVLERATLRFIREERSYARIGETEAPAYRFVRNDLKRDMFRSTEHADALENVGVGHERVVILKRSIGIEEFPYFSSYEEGRPDEIQRLKLVKVRRGDSVEDLLSIQSSIVHVLSNYKLSIARVYALVDKGSEAEMELKRIVNELVSEHGNQE